MGLGGDGLHGPRFEFEAHVIHAQQGLELLDQGVAGGGENRFEGVAVQGFEHGAHRQPANEFRDQAIAHQVVGLQVAQHLGGLEVLVWAAAAIGRQEANGIAAQAPLYQIV